MPIVEARKARERGIAISEGLGMTPQPAMDSFDQPNDPRRHRSIRSDATSYRPPDAFLARRMLARAPSDDLHGQKLDRSPKPLKFRERGINQLLCFVKISDGYRSAVWERSALLPAHAGPLLSRCLAATFPTGVRWKIARQRPESFPEEMRRKAERDGQARHPFNAQGRIEGKAITPSHPRI
jgi:hypothetical protein